MSNPTPVPGPPSALQVPADTDSIAMTAYRDLLNGPLPSCDRDFRRAVMLAVLIGRQIEADKSP